MGGKESNWELQLLFNLEYFCDRQFLNFFFFGGWLFWASEDFFCSSASDLIYIVWNKMKQDDDETRGLWRILPTEK